ncbi:MAG: hypothetical protein V4726_18820 [Verrucomicrobiota bacterium]
MKLRSSHFPDLALAAGLSLWGISVIPLWAQSQEKPALAAGLSEPPKPPDAPGTPAEPKAPENPPPSLSPAAPAPPAGSPAPGLPVEPPRLFDGGVPAGAAEFRGIIKGCVETVGRHQSSFRVKITSAMPDATSKAPKPESLVSSVVLVIQGTDKAADGKWIAKPGHHEWIAALKPGSFVAVPVRYTKAANGFRITAVPAAPKSPGTCDASPAPASPPSGSGMPRAAGPG